jgi:uncharacterized membrane protein
MKNSRLFQLAVIVVLSMVYVAARLWKSAATCLWFDEIFSVHAAEHTWGTIIGFAARDLIHPPLFYLLLKIWISIGGESLDWLRLFPVALAAAALVPFLYLCRELRLSAWSKAIALLLFAVNGSLIKYAQEVRMYSLLLLLSLFSVWLFVRYFHKGKGLPALVIVNILMIYAHYFGWLVVISEVFSIIVFQRIKIRAILIMLASCAAASIPWAIAVWVAAAGGSDVGQNIGWMERPTLAGLGQLAVGLVEPFYFRASNAEPVTIALISVPFLVLIAAGISLGVFDDRKRETEKFETKRLLAIFVVVPIVIAFLASWFLPYSVWGTRHLIIVFVPAVLLIGAVVGRIEVQAVKVGICSALVLLSALAFAVQMRRDTPEYIWCAWEPLAAEAASKGGEKIYVFEDLVAYHFWFALHEAERKNEISKVSNAEGVAEDAAYFLPRGFGEIAKVNMPDVNDDRLWIAYRGEQIDETKAPLALFLARGYRIADRKVFAASGENAILLLLEK